MPRADRKIRLALLTAAALPTAACAGGAGAQTGLLATPEGCEHAAGEWAKGTVYSEVITAYLTNSDSALVTRTAFRFLGFNAQIER